jgi:hypothetical protein
MPLFLPLIRVCRLLLTSVLVAARACLAGCFSKSAQPETRQVNRLDDVISQGSEKTSVKSEVRNKRSLADAKDFKARVLGKR